ncbi:MAG: diguanylate cyclase [Candidatus Izemoplasmatales bacterium]|jgi:diguanylate cyclase (GGDEF)-like protein
MNHGVLLIGATIALALVTLMFSIYLFRKHRKSRGLFLIAVIFFLEFVYAMAYALELAATDLTTKLIFNHLQYFAIPFFAVMWLYVVKVFKDPNFVPKPKWLIVFFAIPVLATICVQIFPYLNRTIYYTDAFIDYAHTADNLGLAVMVLKKGPLYYITGIYTSLILMMVSVICFRLYRAKKGIQSTEALWIGILTILCILAIIPAQFTDYTSGIDMALYIFEIIGFVMFYMMMRYETIDLKPAAHRALFEASSDPILILDDAYDIISWNEAFDHFKDKEVKYRINIDDYFDNLDFCEAIKSEHAYGFTRAGRHFILETVPLIVASRRRTGYIVKFNDMTSYIDRIHVLDFQATHDVLTTIFNRRAFMECCDNYLNKVVQPKEPFAFIMMDIDNFKVVNDTHGHIVGDGVLEYLSLLIKQNIDENIMFARYGGEEFMILLENTDENDAIQLAERIRIIVDEQHFIIDELQLHIQISIGIANGIGGSGLNLHQYIDKADEALYQSKKAGKNQVTSIN